MKRNLMALIALGVGSLFTAAPVSAQNNAIADIPFSFVVSGKPMPAGTYKVTETHPGSVVFSLSNESSGQSSPNSHYAQSTMRRKSPI